MNMTTKCWKLRKEPLFLQGYYCCLFFSWKVLLFIGHTVQKYCWDKCNPAIRCPCYSMARKCDHVLRLSFHSVLIYVNKIIVSRWLAGTLFRGRFAEYSLPDARIHDAYVVIFIYLLSWIFVWNEMWQYYLNELTSDPDVYICGLLFSSFQFCREGGSIQ